MGERMYDATLVVGGYNITGKSNTLELNYKAEMLDRTCFGSSARKRVAGLRDFDARIGGFWGSTNVDYRLYNNVGTTAAVMSVFPTSTDGQTAYFARNVHSEYSPSGSIGELLRFDAVAVGSAGSSKNSLVRGKLLFARGGFGTTARVSTGDSINIGVGTTTQSLYAAVHLCQGITSALTSGAFEAWVVGSCSSDFGVGATTMLAISRTTAASGAWHSTKMHTTAMTFYKLVISTTSGTMNIFASAGVF